jgi:hypothetical protein
MPSHNIAPKKARVAVRLSDLEQKDILEAVKIRGYVSPSAFVRTAIHNKLSGRSDWMDSEQRISGRFDRIAQEIVRLSRGQQALFALVDALTKTVLTCVPEPPADARSQAVARGRERYDRLIKSAGQSMVGDAELAMRELANHVTKE